MGTFDGKVALVTGAARGLGRVTVLAFARGVDVVTFDHEHVPQPVLAALVDAGVAVRPGPHALRHTQDKLVLRERLDELGIPQPVWARVATAEELGVPARFVAADATAWAVAQEHAPDLVVVNPPRRGIGPELATWLEDSDAAHVVYSSCHAVTLARDLALMPSLRPVEARVLDMFPHTTHYEVMVLLAR